MSDGAPIVDLPTPSEQPPFFFWAALAIVGLLVLAVLIDVFRRRRQRKEQIAAEWQSVREIMAERELTADELSILEDLIRRYAPESPLRVATVQRNFDHCIDQEIAHRAQSSGADAIEALGLTLRDLRLRLGLDYIPFGRRIESTRQLVTGQVVWLMPDAASATRWHRFTIVSVDEARFFATREDVHADFAAKPGESVRFRMWREEDARYIFTARLMRIEPQPEAWVFEHTTELKRMQARAHYRMRFDEAVVVSVINAPLDQRYEELALRPVVTKLRGRISSLSAGGVALVMPQPVPGQVLLRVPLDFDEEESLVAHAKIVSSSALSGGRHLVRATFVDISEEERDRITHFVFKRQQPGDSEAPEE